MAKTEVLSVRVSAATRRALIDAAPTRDAAGASAVARDILERWAQRARMETSEESVRRAVLFLRAHPNWDDEPLDFFPAMREL